MPIPNSLRRRADAILSSLADRLATAQASHLAAHGRHFQGIRTPATLPADGVAIAPNHDVKPTDQAESWRDVGIRLPAAMEAAVEVHVYNSPTGRGYVIIGALVSGGKTWRRMINVGSEEYRERDWEEVD